MGVSIGEVEVTPERPITRGDEAAAGSASGGGASMSPTEMEAQVLGILRRETARRERLWAD